MAYKGRPCSACAVDASGTGRLGKGCTCLKAYKGWAYKTYMVPGCTSGELSCTVCKGLWYSPGDDSWNPCID